MPETIVINAGPVIALIAVLGDMAILPQLYHKVIVPYEVNEELIRKGLHHFDVAVYIQDRWLDRRLQPVALSTFLRNSLDRGEAAVIQTALNENIGTVCIDEAVGRRVARLNGLKHTGSLGIMLKAMERGNDINIYQAIRNMKAHGIWISQDLELQVYTLAKKIGRASTEI